MTIDVELKGGPGDSQRYTIEDESSAPEWPPQAIYLPRFGGSAPRAGQLVRKTQIIANGYAVYRRAGRSTAEGRKVYEYEGR
jgi:hypothetical protein